VIYIYIYIAEECLDFSLELFIEKKTRRKKRQRQIKVSPYNYKDSTLSRWSPRGVTPCPFILYKDCSIGSGNGTAACKLIWGSCQSGSLYSSLIWQRNMGSWEAGEILLRALEERGRGGEEGGGDGSEYEKRREIDGRKERGRDETREASERGEMSPCWMARADSMKYLTQW